MKKITVLFDMIKNNGWVLLHVCVCGVCHRSNVIELDVGSKSLRGSQYFPHYLSISDVWVCVGWGVGVVVVVGCGGG